MNGFWCDFCRCTEYDLGYNDDYSEYQINCSKCGRVFDVLSDGRYSVAPQNPPCPRCGWHFGTMDTGDIECPKCGNVYIVRRLMAGDEFVGRLQKPAKKSRNAKSEPRINMKASRAAGKLFLPNGMKPSKKASLKRGPEKHIGRR